MADLEKAVIKAVDNIPIRVSDVATQEVLAHQDREISAIPEVESAVGKLGRAETPLDPAPLSMIETVINYFPFLDDQGTTAGLKDLSCNDPDEEKAEELPTHFFHLFSLTFDPLLAYNFS